MSTLGVGDWPPFEHLARRTAAVRIAVGGCVVLLGALAVIAAPRHARVETPLIPQGRNAVVALDLSASIASDTYPKIASALDQLRREGGRVGLVIFSDSAYVALPPGTPTSELGNFTRFFAFPAQRKPGLLPQPSRNPWTDSFSGGTRISSGLQTALEAIEADRVPHAVVVLVSDLDDDVTDIRTLGRVAVAYESAHIPLKLAGLDPSTANLELFSHLFPRSSSQELEGLGRAAHESHGISAPPTALVVLTVAIACALGATVLATARLRWSDR